MYKVQGRKPAFSRLDEEAGNSEIFEIPTKKYYFHSYALPFPPPSDLTPSLQRFVLYVLLCVFLLALSIFFSWFFSSFCYASQPLEISFAGTYPSASLSYFQMLKSIEAKMQV